MSGILKSVVQLPIASGVGAGNRESCLQSHWRLQSCRQGFQSSVDKISSSSEANSHHNVIPHIQTLTKFPRNQLCGKVVMLRTAFTFPIHDSIQTYILTIKYLYHAGAKLLIASNWGRHKPPSEQTVADNLSSILQLKVMATNWISDCTLSKTANLNDADILLIENLSKFKEEVANCSVFARKLSSGVDILVNETFSQSHKILASTVGVPRYCYASVAGFGFEEELSQIVGITRTTNHPYLAIIGGDNLNKKAAAIQLLASKCDGLVFVGMMAFQIMHAKGQTVPSRFVDLTAVKTSLKIVEYANKRNILVLLPKDFLCSNDKLPKQLRTFPAQEVLEGWEPVELGPSSMTEISYVLSTCKKILSIGPLKFRSQRADSHVTSKLAVLLETSTGNGCGVTVIGSAACKDFGSTSACTLFKNASVAWEFLNGSVLPGLTALDRAYPFEVEWEKVFDDPTQPLVIDIGSG